MNKKIRTPFSGLIDSVWKIRSRHFHPNMSYNRPESFYLLHPRSRGPHGTTAMDGGSVENIGTIFYQGRPWPKKRDLQVPFLTT